MQRKTIMPIALLIVIVSTFSMAVFSEEKTNIAFIYEKFGKVRNDIFTTTGAKDISTDTVVNMFEEKTMVEEYMKEIQPLLDSDEAKALATILRIDLLDIITAEKLVKNKPLPNEPMRDYWARMDNIVNQFVIETKNDLQDVFLNYNIPENSYLKITYHRRMIHLTNMGFIVKKTELPNTIHEHCDQLIKGPLFHENPDIIQPTIPMPYIWNSSLFRNQDNAIKLIREFLYNYRVREIMLQKQKEGNSLLESRGQEKLTESKNQLMFAAYPLSDYPFLEKFLSSDDQ